MKDTSSQEPPLELDDWYASLRADYPLLTGSKRRWDEVEGDASPILERYRWTANGVISLTPEGLSTPILEAAVHRVMTHPPDSEPYDVERIARTDLLREFRELDLVTAYNLDRLSEGAKPRTAPRHAVQEILTAAGDRAGVVPKRDAGRRRVLSNRTYLLLYEELLALGRMIRNVGLRGQKLVKDALPEFVEMTAGKLPEDLDQILVPFVTPEELMRLRGEAAGDWARWLLTNRTPADLSIGTIHKAIRKGRKDSKEGTA